MTHTQALEDWQFTFENYEQLNCSSYETELQVFRDYVEEHEADFNGEEDDLASG